jgi:hypothetical protein
MLDRICSQTQGCQDRDLTPKIVRSALFQHGIDLTPIEDRKSARSGQRAEETRGICAVLRVGEDGCVTRRPNSTDPDLSLLCWLALAKTGKNRQQRGFGKTSGLIISIFYFLFLTKTTPFYVFFL